MTKQIDRIIAASMADINERLKTCVPAFSFSDSLIVGRNKENLPLFFDKMLSFEAGIFSPVMQQYIAALTEIPFWSCDSRAMHFADRRFEMHFMRGLHNQQDLTGSWKGQPLYNFISDNLEKHFWLKDIKDAYTRKLHSIGCDQIDVPPKFSSLQIVLFFKGVRYFESQSHGVAPQMMRHMLDAADHLKPGATEEAVFDIVTRLTGLPRNNALAVQFVDVLALRQRANIFNNEHDRLLRDVLFETLQNDGYRGDQDFQWDLYATYLKKNAPVEYTKGQVHASVKKALSSFYYLIMENYKRQKRPDKKHLIQPVSVDPDSLGPTDTTSTDIREIIREESKYTAGRTASSLMHNAPYRDSSRPSPKPKGRKGKKPQP